mmetsp:Transcript_18605/g.28282  ORF Transcript_18605/g.28282 Transcript_18605/m.28282 type:complete len:89 (+) Transcript_18605:80-346(+)
MIETTINEARAEGSNSHLKHLPNDALNNVYGYLLGKEFENNEDAEISDQISKSIPKIDRRIGKRASFNLALTFLISLSLKLATKLLFL